MASVPGAPVVAGVRAMQQPSPSGPDDCSLGQAGCSSGPELDDTFEVDLVQIATEDADERWSEAVRLILKAAARVEE